MHSRSLTGNKKQTNCRSGGKPSRWEKAASETGPTVYSLRLVNAESGIWLTSQIVQITRSNENILMTLCLIIARFWGPIVLPSFKPWRTRYEPVNYGISRKCTARFTRFSSLVLIRLVLTEIQPFENVKICKEMYGHPDAVRHGVRMPYMSLLILNFLNRCISVKTSLINTKLGNLVNLGVLFLTMWINSC